MGLGDLFILFMYTIISSTNSDTLMSSFPICMSLIFFSCLIALAITLSTFLGETAMNFYEALWFFGVFLFLFLHKNHNICLVTISFWPSDTSQICNKSCRINQVQQPNGFCQKSLAFTIKEVSEETSPFLSFEAFKFGYKLRKFDY